MSEESILLHPDPAASGDGGLHDCLASMQLGLRRAYKHCRGQLFRRSSILLLTLLLLQVALIVLQKCVTIRMVNYPYVLAQTQPMCTTMLFMGLYLLMNNYVRRKQEEAAQAKFPTPPSEHVTETSSIQRLPTVPEHEPFPKWKFLIMGVLFTLANFMLFAGNRGDIIPGPIALLLAQAVIPFSFAFSFVFLGTRYSIAHYLGALIVLAGIFLSLWPQLDALRGLGTVFWAYLLLVGSAAFTAGAIVLMEHSFKQHRMPLYYAWVWINIFEIFAALPLMFAIIPIQGIAVRDIPKNIIDGYMCLLTRHNSQPGDECENVLFLYLAYLLALVANKVNVAYVVKFHSATQMWTAVTCAIPLANLAFCLRFIMGEHTSKFGLWPLVALAVVFVGLLVYRSTKERQREAPEQGEKSFWYEYPSGPSS